MKDIQVGDYWHVNYNKYKGIVLVREQITEFLGYSKNGAEYDPIDDWSCEVAEELPIKKWNNYMSGSRFKKKDFRKKTTEQEFYASRAKFLQKETNNALRKAK